MVVSAQINRPPKLKSGRQAFSSKVTRSRVNGKNRVTLALSKSENINLDLVPNNDLLTSDYEEIDLSPNGLKNVVRTGDKMNVCWYNGRVSGEDSSQVIASDCGGGFDGVIQRANGKTYVARSVGVDDVSVHLSEDEEASSGTCGVDHDHDHDHSDDEAHGEHIHSTASVAPPSRRLMQTVTDPNTNVVEIAIVSDRAYVVANGGAFGRNTTALSERNIQIMNTVQAIYQATSFSVPMTIKLKAQYFFSSQDPYSMPVDSNGEVDDGALLVNFRSWVLGNLSVAYDHVHLLSGYNFEGSTVGLAYVASACGSYREGISMAGQSTGAVANTVAHELGHSLGMVHDGAANNNCPSSGYLMSAVSSCGTSGLCPISNCSIASENAFTASVSCLHSWTNPTCSDKVMNGAETGIDCGGPSCPACTTSGCSVNNGGCAQLCIPTGGMAYVCACSDPSMYLDTVSGTACISDINQCLTNPCQETCTNTIGPGNSYTCSCALPNYLSLTDGKSCLAPSCFDGRKNQDEVMIDCGGVCARPCNCLVSSASFQGSYDRGFNLNGATWKMWDNSNQYALIKYGVPIRYLYRLSSNQWNYDDDLDTSGYWGVAFPPSLATVPYSGSWQFYDGSNFNSRPFTFSSCAAATPTCGNGVLEPGEECESCLEFSGGVCRKPNPCCDSTCLGPSARGTTCSLGNLAGACWDGNCITRGATCDLITSTTYCFSSTSSSCDLYTGGQSCTGVSERTFTAKSCNASLYCFSGSCGQTNFPGSVGQIRGFPCSSPNANGVYPYVCDGGPQGTGESSSCVAVSSLTKSLPPTPSQTVAPTLRPTTFPSLAPTKYPTLAPTNVPTKYPTLAPTVFPTNLPTKYPTLTPTLSPTNIPTQVPTFIPTNSPTDVPTRFPSFAPTLFPTYAPSQFPSFTPSLFPTDAPTQFPSFAPTALPTALPTNTPVLNLPPISLTIAPSTNDLTLSPTLSPTAQAPDTVANRDTPKPTARPTTDRPTLKPTAMPTTRNPTLLPTRRPTRTPTSKATKQPTRKPTFRPSRAPTSAKPTRFPTSRSTIRPTTARPTRMPSVRPTSRPTRIPTFRPTSRPTQTPTTRRPTARPTARPSRTPTARPTARPSRTPTARPSRTPTARPTARPTRTPTARPTTTRPTLA